MKIFYIADAASWHNSLWVSYFTRSNDCLLFSDERTEENKVQMPKALRLIMKRPVFDMKNRHINKLTSLYSYARHCIRISVREKPDVIHAVAIYYGFIAAVVSRATGVPLVYTLQGSEVLVNAKKHFLYRYMLRKTIHQASLVTGDSRTILTEALRYGLVKEKALHIQNGVPLDEFMPLENKKEIEALKFSFFNGEVEEKIVFSPRAITELYNPELILDALKLLVDRKVKVRGVFAYGFGEERLPELRSKAKELGLEEVCYWSGFLSHKNIIEIYQMADVVVSVPKSDSSPKSVYESMACATPVVVSNLPWVHEFFGDAVYLCDTATPVAIADQIERALKDVESGNIEKIDTAFKLVEKHISYEANMKAMEHQLKSLVGVSSD